MHKSSIKGSVQRFFKKKRIGRKTQPKYLATNPCQVFFIIFLIYITLNLPATAILCINFWNPRSTSIFLLLLS